jgi:hypothetical protein
MYVSICMYMYELFLPLCYIELLSLSMMYSVQGLGMCATDTDLIRGLPFFCEIAGSYGAINACYGFAEQIRLRLWSRNKVIMTKKLSVSTWNASCTYVLVLDGGMYAGIDLHACLRSNAWTVLPKHAHVHCSAKTRACGSAKTHAHLHRAKPCQKKSAI